MTLPIRVRYFQRDKEGMTHMNKRTLFVFITALVSFTNAATAERVTFAPIDAVSTCFTLEETKPCGESGTGPSITCNDGTSGPGWIRVAEKTYKCMVCPQHQSGKRDCDNSEGIAQEKLIIYQCRGGTYTEVKEIVLQSCNKAVLSGNKCEG